MPGKMGSLKKPVECTICRKTILIFAVRPCGHYCCHVCALRVRKLGSHQCSTCRARTAAVYLTLNPVILDDSNVDFRELLHTNTLSPTGRRSPEKSHDNLLATSTKKKISTDLLDPSHPKGFFFDKDLCFYYKQESILESVNLLRGFYCPRVQCWPNGASQAFSSLQELKDHLRETHQRFYCELCLRFRSAFLSEQYVYSNLSLMQHLNGRWVEDDASFQGHVRCHFCKTHLYDVDFFVAHMRDQHMLCELCHEGDTPNRYFSSPRFLYEHFENAHYICQHPACSQQTMILKVFSTLRDLNEHLTKVHQVRVRKQSNSEVELFNFTYGFTTEHQKQTENIATSTTRGMTPEEARTNRILFDFGSYQRENILWKTTTPSSSQNVNIGSTTSSPRKLSGGVTKIKDESCSALLPHTRVSLPNGFSKGMEKEKANALLWAFTRKKLSEGTMMEIETFREHGSDFLRGELKSKKFYDIMREIYGTEIELIFPLILQLVPEGMQREALGSLHDMHQASVAPLHAPPGGSKTGHRVYSTLVHPPPPHNGGTKLTKKHREPPQEGLQITEREARIEKTLTQAPTKQHPDGDEENSLSVFFDITYRAPLKKTGPEGASTSRNSPPTVAGPCLRGAWAERQRRRLVASSDPMEKTWNPLPTRPKEGNQTKATANTIPARPVRGRISGRPHVPNQKSVRNNLDKSAPVWTPGHLIRLYREKHTEK